MPCLYLVGAIVIAAAMMLYAVMRSPCVRCEEYAVIVGVSTSLLIKWTRRYRYVFAKKG